MVLSLLPDRRREREVQGGRGQGHRGGPVQERGVLYPPRSFEAGWARKK